MATLESWFHTHLPRSGLGLELRDNDFLGVPGGEGTGVGPLALALLSPTTDR